MEELPRKLFKEDKHRDVPSEVIQIVLWYLDSGCSKYMIGQRSQLINFVSNFLGTVRFGNDQIVEIIGYGDYQLAKQGLVRGLPKLKFEKDHLCSACSLGKGKKASHKPKAVDTNQEKLYLLHMDLCGPMRVESINRKKYILVIIDDYSRFTWVKFLHLKDEAPEIIIKCLKQIQVRINATVCERLDRTDKGTIRVGDIRLLEIIMRTSASHMKHQFLALHNKMALPKDETKLLWKLLAPC
ncbi:retrovirus-related pol polyprotein from transposon TNT 1-94 [Tanacetum coccineum]